jgi:hypothetical protein
VSAEADHLHDFGPIHADWDDGYAWGDEIGLHFVGSMSRVPDGWQWRVPVNVDPDEIVTLMCRFQRALDVLLMCQRPMEMLQEIYGISERTGLPGMPRIRAALEASLEHSCILRKRNLGDAGGGGEGADE